MYQNDVEMTLHTPTSLIPPFREGEFFACSEHGNIVPEKRVILNLVLDDGSENMRAVLFNEQLEQLNLKNLKWKDLGFTLKNRKVGKEKILL